MDQSLLYRSALRVSAVVTAFILVFQSGLVDDRTAVVFTEATGSLYATVVGASASVRTTEVNQITAELTKQQQLLASREELITEREIELGLAQGSTQSSNQTTTYLLAAILLIQLILLMLNYVLDYLRSKERKVVSA
jgi:membrane-associated HD superfamily phosphohydrolase